MRDLAVIVPSRGRPQRLRSMLLAAIGLSRADTVLVVATDDDDPERGAYEAALAPLLGCGRVHHLTGPRRSLTEWTNAAAAAYAGDFRALASFGDDHVPRTDGWDRALLAAVDAMGGTGFAYPDDRRRADVPEAVVVSSDIVRALGWMALPECRHFWIDNAWADLGREAGCIRYCPDVTVEHQHYEVRPDVPRDATNAEAEARGGEDRAAYQAWRAGRMAGDVAVIRKLRAGAAATTTRPACPSAATPAASSG